MRAMSGIRYANYTFSDTDVNSEWLFPNFNFEDIWYTVSEELWDETTFTGVYFYNVLPFLYLEWTTGQPVTPPEGDGMNTQYGNRISERDMCSRATYPNFDFDTPIWAVDCSDERKVFLSPHLSLIRFDGNRYGKQLTTLETLDESTYGGFAFSKVWGMPIDNIPVLLNPTHFELGEPNTSRSHMVLLDDVSLGDQRSANIYYEGRLFKVDSVIRSEEVVSKDEYGEDVITWEYFGNETSDGEGFYLMSGIENDEYLAQFGDYSKEQEVEVEFLEERSNEVAFYYADTLSPLHDYALGLSTPTGIVRVPVLRRRQSDIVCVMPDGTTGFVATTSVNGAMASNIRYQSAGGTRALQRISPD